jgi:predicted MPP superfamily phosphohydrolase
MIACQVLDVSLAVLLLLAACAGHTALLTFGLNWLFAQPLPRNLLRVMRKAHFLAVLAGPALFWFVAGLGRDARLEPYPRWGEPWDLLIKAYVLLCWAVGLGWLPLASLLRLLRRRPAALVSNHAVTVDVAAELGYKPVGRGKHRRMARLPGNQIFQVEFSERTFRLSRLPAAWDGLTVLHLSDLHLCGTPDREFYERVMDRCRAWEPDLLALTGDVVDTEHHHRWIVPVLGRLRWRVAAFAILGNHDYWYEPNLVRRRLRRLGMHVLGNVWERTEVRGEPLVVVGHEGPWFRPGPDLTDCPDGTFRLCLSHTPDNIRWAQAHGIDLMLSGHNHGGQIRLPLLGSLFVPSRYSRRYDCGVFDELPTLLHVSRGLAGQQPLRINCRPEVTRIVLQRA